MFLAIGAKCLYCSGTVSKSTRNQSTVSGLKSSLDSDPVDVAAVASECPSSSLFGADSSESVKISKSTSVESEPVAESTTSGTASANAESSAAGCAIMLSP